MFFPSLKAHSRLKPRIATMRRNPAIYFLFYIFLHLIPPTAAQTLDPDWIDFRNIPGWVDLRVCLKNCFWNCGGGSVNEGNAQSCQPPAANVGCSTNRCICQPTPLYISLGYIESCIAKSCLTVEEPKLGRQLFGDYCKSKGYTSVGTATIQTTETPTRLPTEYQTHVGAVTVTQTVGTVTVTAYVRQTFSGARDVQRAGDGRGGYGVLAYAAFVALLVASLQMAMYLCPA